VNGIDCLAYTIATDDYDTGYDGTYTFYVAAADGTPVQFHFTGFNVILGSHYDECASSALALSSSAARARVGGRALVSFSPRSLARVGHALPPARSRVCRAARNRRGGR
jgi:hypothetical protein